MSHLFYFEYYESMGGNIAIMFMLCNDEASAADYFYTNYPNRLLIKVSPVIDFDSGYIIKPQQSEMLLTLSETLITKIARIDKYEANESTLIKYQDAKNNIAYLLILNCGATNAVNYFQNNLFSNTLLEIHNFKWNKNVIYEFSSRQVDNHLEIILTETDKDN